MYRAVLLLVCAGTCFAGQPTEDAVKKELKRFQGKWTCVGGHANGKPFDEEMKKKFTMVVEGNKFVLKEDDKIAVEGTFTIDPSKKLKTIDAEVTMPITGKLLGIYQIDGDTRKSCFANVGKDRPDGFRNEADHMILEWKEAK